jgi:hypothetical protein
MKELNEIGIIPLTIHDSLVVNEREKDKVLEVLIDKFQRLHGLVPSFHIEQLGESDCDEVVFTEEDLDEGLASFLSFNDNNEESDYAA